MNPGFEEDASISDNVTSRFMNYYIEGQKYMYDTLGISGLYYDGFNAELFIQKRIRRMSSKYNAMFDVHGRAFQNTELLPFVDFMWTCEGIDFTKGPDYWLVSIASIPFGVFGEMLGADNTAPVPGTFCGESCAEKHRGMLFGMSNRAGWTGVDPNDNSGLWKLWDSFGIADADMLGWWNRSSPVAIDASSGVYATAYVKHGDETLIAIASWNVDAVNVTVSIDWNAIGLGEATKKRVYAPILPSFNNGNSQEVDFPIEDCGGITINVPALRGWLLVASSSSHAKEIM